MENSQSYVAFAGTVRVASGSRAEVALRAQQHVDLGDASPLRVFDEATGREVELDLLSDAYEQGSCSPTHEAQGEPRANPGRPRLGVVGGEVSLFPRHWQWLEQQPGGASAALRRLVEHARKQNVPAQRARAAREAAGQFMWSMTGNLPGFEEATRALFAGEQARLEQLISEWPADLRSQVEKLSRQALRLEQGQVPPSGPELLSQA